MRLLLILLIPGIVSFLGLALRTWLSMRVAEQERIIDATVTSARSSSPGAESMPGRRGRPPCGRYNLHLFFRLVGGDEGCRHCAAIERARFEADTAAAVDAAEQAVRGDQR